MHPTLPPQRVRVYIFKDETVLPMNYKKESPLHEKTVNPKTYPSFLRTWRKKGLDDLSGQSPQENNGNQPPSDLDGLSIGGFGSSRRCCKRKWTPRQQRSMTLAHVFVKPECAARLFASIAH